MLRCPHCHTTEPIYRSRFRVWASAREVFTKLALGGRFHRA